MKKIEGILDLTVDTERFHSIKYGEVIHFARLEAEYISWRKRDIGDWIILNGLKGPIIRHYHEKSELMCATCWVDKFAWMCNTCGEEVPRGILFIARTEKLG